MAHRTLKIALAAAPLWIGAASAVPPQGSSYYTDGQNSYVEDATSQGIGTVNMIACFIGAMRPDALVNENNYVALVDEKKCDPNARSSTSNSGGGGGQDVPQYTRAIVNSTRTSNSDPMQVKVWVASEMGQSNATATIFVKATATEAPSTGNPYGQFRLDFCGKFDTDAITAPCLMTGYIDAASTGLQFFQDESGGGEGQRVTQLALTQGSGGNNGQGRLAMQESNGGQSLSTTFSFAYDSSYYLRGDSVTNQNLCFSRLEVDAKKSVWRYGLYNDDGSHVDVNSGFPVTWTNPGDSKTYQGNMGYYGLWMESNVGDQVPNGATLTRQSFQQGAVGENYTLFKARGRLTKYTKQTTKLDRVTNVRMNVSMQVNSQWQQVEVYWNGTQFVKSGVMMCGQNGCNTQSVNPVEPIDNNLWANFGGIFGWSQSLGGEVFIKDVAGLANPALVDVVYRVQSLVYPGEGPASLKCMGECPDAASMTAFFTNQGATSPFIANTMGAAFNPNGVAAANLVSYTQSSSSGELTLAGDSTPIVITDPNWLANQPQFQNGVMTGKLFDANDDTNVRCDADTTKYCGAKLNDLQVYYQWQTGTQNWSQFFALRAPTGSCAGSTDAFCRFDPPLSVTYSVPNDSVAYGVYAGQDVILQYGGFGNLWGIPGTCVDRFTNASVDCGQGGQNVRWVPAFAIPFDMTTGRVTAGPHRLVRAFLCRRAAIRRIAPQPSALLRNREAIFQSPWFSIAYAIADACEARNRDHVPNEMASAPLWSLAALAICGT